jgi:DNA polymerase-3 subunit gamma/tau
MWCLTLLRKAWGTLLAMSLALARKYRPKSFADVAVQSHVSNTLRGAIARRKVAHAYLLSGPRGVGKTTLARVLAMALNCENKREDGEPCGECTSCQRIWSGSSSLDVVEIDAASNRGVDDARELRERAMYAPSGEDRYKVYIVDEAHMLTREAWNALLKILEEPPPRVVFVFATTEPQKIAQAAAPVLSRVQRFDLRRIGLADISRRLSTVLDKEGVKASDDAIALIARAADGSMRDALSLTDQVISLGGGTVTADRVREALGLVAEDEFIKLLDLIAEHRAGEIFDAVNRLTDSGVDFGVFLSGFADILRAQLTVVLNGKADAVSAAAAAALRERKDRFTAGDLLRMIGAINALEPNFRKSSQQQLLIEMLLVRMALLDRTVALEDMLKGLSEGIGAQRIEQPSGSVRAQQSQGAVARTAQRPATRPGYPPQIDAPNTPVQKPEPRQSSAPTNESQLLEMKRAMETTAQDTNRSRMTPEALKEERIGMLRQKDPALGTAIDELDLELLD